jgi:VanZ family protein
LSSTTVSNQPVSASPQRTWLAWLPTLLWLCVLALFSTDIFSAEHTARVLTKIFYVLFGGVSSHGFGLVHYLIRKTAHFTSYGLLSALTFFSWRATLPARRRWSFRWCELALLLTLLAASLDEFHQTFVPSRTGNYHDVILDMIGALFFQLVLALWLGGKKARLNQ